MFVNDLENAKKFFVDFLGGVSSSGYHNEKTGFKSYFISFEDGARLEIMNRPDMTDDKKIRTVPAMLTLHFPWETKKKWTSLRFNFSQETDLIKKVENISKEQLKKIKSIIGEAFVTNELFHDWGSIEERHDDVLKYMSIYVDFVYQSGELYANEDFTGFIGLENSESAPRIPQIKMLVKMMLKIKRSKLKSLVHFAKQIGNANEQYASQPHIDTLMVCVDKNYQGKGLASELVAFAKKMAETENVPLLFGTDMKDYADMYVHFGCSLYNSVTADNGVTRYCLCYEP